MTQQTLDELIAAGQTSEEAREAFYQQLPNATLFVLVNSDVPEGAQRFAMAGEPDFTWAVADMGYGVCVPAFTNKAAMDDFLSKVDGWENRWIETEGADLLMQMAETSLYLEINPASQLGVGLPPEHIQAMAAALQE